MTGKKNHFKIRNNQERAGELYNPVALSLPVFWNGNKTATTSMFKMQHMPQMFLQWLFTSRVKLYCSVARFITSASYPQNETYVPERSSIIDYQPLLKKLA